ncbi:Predicted dehydrogenase [Paenibacillus sp. UNCCL117]|uniref:Gfo/Idh/MocA family protein n=1 Tax=unclassified Paenibacillus TaxID=185978 RepID=UPI00088F150B|nr:MULTISPECIES: Gfo/Idh/MocA family oxidoreductase [unclassified Paenibacillus]SDD24379.1 Predicted dehydrogenase [Paenibacillus sp. cl123]SFW41498.1 Predicted dehydrogenase [Paenibacillus sp. UNCCL117]
MKTIRLGMVGLGRFAQLHLACLRQLPMVEIAAVCDVRREAADALAAQLGCRGYSDVRDMIGEEALDALDVLTPEAFHCEAAMAALNAGVHVFVEKPLAVDLAEAERMTAAAAARGKLLMTGHLTRFDPRYVGMRQAIERGEIGRVRSFYARRSDKREFFGLYKRTSPIHILGAHDIDQLLWYTGEMPIEVYARSSSSEEGVDQVCAMLALPGGATAILDANWLAPKAWPAPQDQYTQVAGDRGVLVMRHPDHSLGICTEEKSEIPYLYANRDLYGTLEGPLMSELRHFVDCVRDSRPSAILRPEDALGVVRVAEAIARSCELGRAVRLEERGS